MSEYKWIAEWYGLYMERLHGGKGWVVGNYQGQWETLPQGATEAQIRVVCERLD